MRLAPSSIYTAHQKKIACAIAGPAIRRKIHSLVIGMQKRTGFLARSVYTSTHVLRFAKAAVWLQMRYVNIGTTKAARPAGCKIKAALVGRKAGLRFPEFRIDFTTQIDGFAPALRCFVGNKNIEAAKTAGPVFAGKYYPLPILRNNL